MSPYDKVYLGLSELRSLISILEAECSETNPSRYARVQAAKGISKDAEAGFNELIDRRSDRKVSKSP